MLHRVCCPRLLFGFSEVQGIHLKAVVGLQALKAITYNESFVVEFFPHCSYKNILWILKCWQVEALEYVSTSVGL